MARRTGRVTKARLFRTQQFIERQITLWTDGSRFEEVHRLTRFSTVPDGYPTNSIPAGSRGSGKLTSVEAAVVGRTAYVKDGEEGNLIVDGHAVVVDRHPEPDVVQQCCEMIAEEQGKIHNSLTKMAAAWATIKGIKLPDPLGICMACKRTVARTVADPIRRGLCGNCDQALRREKAQGPVSMVDFCRRREELERAKVQS